MLNRREAIGCGLGALVGRVDSPAKNRPAMFKVALLKAIVELRMAGRVTRNEAIKYRRGLRDTRVSSGAYAYCCGEMVATADRWDQLGVWWGELVQWIKDNWGQIVKVLATLIMVVLNEEKNGRLDLGPLHIDW